MHIFLGQFSCYFYFNFHSFSHRSVFTWGRFGVLWFCCLSFVVLFTFASSMCVCVCVCVCLGVCRCFTLFFFICIFYIFFFFLGIICTLFRRASVLMLNLLFFCILLNILFDFSTWFLFIFIFLISSLSLFFLFWQHFYIWRVAKVSLIHIYLYSLRVRPIVCAI